MEFDEAPMEAIVERVENTGNDELAKRFMLPCKMSIPESSLFLFTTGEKGRMLDYLLVCRNILAYYKGFEVHSELLHDGSAAKATYIKFPE